MDHSLLHVSDKVRRSLLVVHSWSHFHQEASSPHPSRMPERISTTCIGGRCEEQNPNVKIKRPHGHFLKLAIFDPVRRRPALADAECKVVAKEKPTDNQQPIGQSVELQRARED
ncbi:hypothetical protein C4D60_Mb10t14140 [Musa balbisiana]|uniref:Uncharacterized protein n=1 Tax=Musa balbisiana TaxID=52838 RepID=A0A4S8IX39_MUSBA|nr:hypothetical protein C4D60_Mb10t14140 [Musa balbisiana]